MKTAAVTPQMLLDNVEVWSTHAGELYCTSSDFCDFCPFSGKSLGCKLGSAAALKSLSILTKTHPEVALVRTVRNSTAPPTTL